jgi:hypothetical protein
MAQDSLALAQDSRPPQLGASLVGRCLGAYALSSLAPLGEMAGRWSNMVAVLLCYRFLGMA